MADELVRAAAALDGATAPVVAAGAGMGFDSGGRAMRDGCFVFTSNVDGHFQRAGFDADRTDCGDGGLKWAHRLLGSLLAPSRQRVRAYRVWTREPMRGAVPHSGTRLATLQHRIQT